MFEINEKLFSRKVQNSKKMLKHNENYNGIFNDLKEIDELKVSNINGRGDGRYVRDLGGPLMDNSTEDIVGKARFTANLGAIGLRVGPIGGAIGLIGGLVLGEMLFNKKK